MSCLSPPDCSLILTLLLDRLNSSFISTHLFKVFNLLEAKENMDVKQEKQHDALLKFPTLASAKSACAPSAEHVAMLRRITCRETLWRPYPEIHDHSLPSLCQWGNSNLEGKQSELNCSITIFAAYYDARLEPRSLSREMQ